MQNKEINFQFLAETFSWVTTKPEFPTPNGDVLPENNFPGIMILPKNTYSNNGLFITNDIVKRAIRNIKRSEDLKPYQAELIKLQKHLERYDKKIIILFDGRDASGKGSAIRRITHYMNKKHYRVIALGRPSDVQKTELHMKRYVESFPHAGEIVLFDRSWYNRALVEPVLGFCTPKQYKKFINNVNSYEENFLDDGNTTLIKLYFSVSKSEQKRRFKRRKNDPLRQWKLSEVDLQAQKLWDEFTVMKYKMLKKSHTKTSPWIVIRSNNKHLARRETMKVILNSIRYRGRSKKLDFQVDPNIVLSGEVALKKMKNTKRKVTCPH